MTLRAIALSFLMLFAPAAAWANDTGTAKAAAYIQALGHKALDALAKKELSKEAKLKTLEGIFRDNADFPWVSRFVTARFWRTATPEQQKQFTEAYQNFLIKHYTSRFTEYTSGSFKITGSNATGEENEYVVNMEIMAGGGEPPILIDYKVRKDKGGFKVFDIIVEGVSLITTQRSEFASVLNGKGIDALTQLLIDKTSGKAAAAK